MALVDKNFYDGVLPGFVFVLLSLGAIFGITINLSKDLSKMPCDFLACEYKDVIIPTLELSAAIVLLPVAVSFLLNIYYPSLDSILLVFTVIYWVLVSFVISFACFKLKRSQPNRKIDKKEQGIRFLTNFGLFIISLFLFLEITIVFLYYPKINMNIDFRDFITLSSFLVIVITLFLKLEERNTEKYVSTSIIKLGLVSIFLLVMGTYLSLIFTARIPAPTETLVGIALTKAVQTGTFVAGFTGLFVIFGLMLSSYKPHD